MSDVYEYLANIKAVEPNFSLLEKIRGKIQQRNQISLFWVRAVACGLLVGMSAELFVVNSTSPQAQEDMSMLITKTNNILYDE